MKPLIGVVPMYDLENERPYVTPDYTQSLEKSGAVPVILTLTENREVLEYYVNLCDGFLFTGGPDVDPALYGEERSPLCDRACPVLDGMEKEFFPLALKSGKPLFGICRGFQFFNVMLGGSLYQDLHTQRPGPVEHQCEPPYDQVSHTVSVENDSLLYRLTGAGEQQVNSFHHQGVKALGNGLKIAARAADGVPEALWLPEHRFFLAVQWHPEFLYDCDEDSRKIWTAFVNACAGV